MQKPCIEYPCRWYYTIIGQNEPLLFKAATNAAGVKPHSIFPSKQSSSGKYRSVTLELEVTSDTERLEIFEKLGQDGNVRIVI